MQVRYNRAMHFSHPFQHIEMILQLSLVGSGLRCTFFLFRLLEIFDGLIQKCLCCTPNPSFLEPEVENIAQCRVNIGKQRLLSLFSNATARLEHDTFDLRFGLLSLLLICAFRLSLLHYRHVFDITGDHREAFWHQGSGDGEVLHAIELVIDEGLEEAVHCLLKAIVNHLTLKSSQENLYSAEHSLILLSCEAFQVGVVLTSKSDQVGKTHLTQEERGHYERLASAFTCFSLLLLSLCGVLHQLHGPPNYVVLTIHRRTHFTLQEGLRLAIPSVLPEGVKQRKAGTREKGLIRVSTCEKAAGLMR
mmetsp:Transcript_7210/g.18715  ORF Transcript_7210/g.18715 Transcript_7210/m.18715 type:complete len:305 (+) Transcript_7210:658-1572(+)